MSYSNASILIVDDEDSNRDILSRRLTKEGYTVAAAEGGKQALDMMRVERYDLVLLDLMMPGVDGYQVLQLIKADTALQNVPVIMVTALSDKPTVKRCLELGATDYVGKPFELTYLKTRIWRAIQSLNQVRHSNAERQGTDDASTVLIVDDDELNLDILVRRLKMAGHAAHVAASGTEALGLLAKQHYDLILLDIMMAKVDGFEVLEKIREQPALAGVPVIMVSAINDTATIERCRKLGANDFISKPYSAATLKERVVELLNPERKRSLLEH